VRLIIIAEPERQFALVRTHIADLRCIAEFEYSPVMIFVVGAPRFGFGQHITHIIITSLSAQERNLGFEAEHMHRALRDEPHVVFFRDEQAGRTGICTTEAVKHGAMTLTNVMLREGRLCMLPVDQLVARDPQEARRRLREQLEIYSLQYKSPETVFQKGRVALSGKVGGFKDDLVICLQLGLYWTESCRLVAAA
jgi:hypothetical protein